MLTFSIVIIDRDLSEGPLRDTRYTLSGGGGGGEREEGIWFCHSEIYVIPIRLFSILMIPLTRWQSIV